MTRMLDAPALVRAMTLYAQALERFRGELDSLNVFPVPDGDTGTNLLHTQRAVTDALEDGAGLEGVDDIAAAAEIISRAALTGARGNSGVILSQVLRAFCAALPVHGAVGSSTANGLREAAVAARRAVAEPKEGTVLSVLDGAAAAGTGSGSADAGDVLAAALAGARAALEDTPEQLPELHAAGVVDAGGKGAVLLLDALHAAVTGGALTEPSGPSGPVGRPAGVGPSPSEPLTYPFEVEFLLEGGHADDLARLRSELAGMGDSLAIVGGDDLHRVHIHTDRPDEVLAVAGRAGTVRDESTTSLQVQVADCLGRAARGVQAGTASLVAPGAEGTALLAVVELSEVGDALGSLGAAVVDPADGNAMAARLRRESGPSAAGRVVVLVEHARADGIRERLSGNGDPDVAIVAARNLAAMISAAAEFHPDASPADNVAGMTRAAARIHAGELAANETGALLDLVAGLAAAAPDAEVLTVVVGSEVPPNDLDAVVTALAGRFPALRVEALRGGASIPAYQIGLE